jgi:hypothetical protein
MENLPQNRYPKLNGMEKFTPKIFYTLNKRKLPLKGRIMPLKIILYQFKIGLKLFLGHFSI